MSSSVPPTYYFNGIQYNSDFFKSSTDPVTLDYATQNYLAKVGVPTSIASNTSFTGDMVIAGNVSFNNADTPPHCSTLPSNANDLCNKQYVDSQAPLTAYQLYLNYSETTVVGANTYKKLSQTQVNVPSPISWTTNTAGAEVFVAGFYNTLVLLNIPLTIPIGVWTLLVLCNVNTIADQNHVGIKYRLYRYDAAGVETLIADPAISQLLTVVDTLKGTTSIVSTVNLSVNPMPAGTVGIGIKLYVVSNVGATRTGNIYFQNIEDYSSILTSFAVQQAPDLITLDNDWTGTNRFQKDTVGALQSLNDAVFHDVKIGRGAMDNSSLLLGSGTIAKSGTATGNTNVIIGNNTAKNLASGNGNVVIGYDTGAALTDSGANTFIGYTAGASTTGIYGNNTCIGFASNINAGLTDCTAIGANAVCTTANTVQLGSPLQTVSCGNVLLSNTTNTYINTSTTGATLNINTRTASGTGFIAFNPRGTNCFNMNFDKNVSVKLLEANAGITMVVGSLAMGTNAITGTGVIGCGNIDSTGTITTSNATAANVNYNLKDLTNPTNTVGTIYGNSTQFYLENKVASGYITLFLLPASGAAVNYGFNSSLLSCPAALSTVGNATIGGFLTTGAITINTTDPSLVSTNTSYPLLLQSPAGQGINLKTNGASGVITSISNTGAVTMPSTLGCGKITTSDVVECSSATLGGIRQTSNVTSPFIIQSGYSTTIGTDFYVNAANCNYMSAVPTGTGSTALITMKQTVVIDKNTTINSVQVGRGFMTGGVLIGSGTIGNSGAVSGANNVLIGNNTGSVLTTGTENVFIGSSSGTSIISGSNNICIGQNTSAGAAISNSVAIGVNAAVSVSNTVQIGNTGAAISLGGSSSTIIIDGSVRNSVSTEVTGTLTVTLALPLKRYYACSNTIQIGVIMPIPSASIAGTKITFRRKNTGVGIVLACNTSPAIYNLFTSTVAATSFTSTATYFNTDVWTDGAFWYQSFLN